MSAPNLVLITVECWRGDHLGPFTPRLDQFRNESTVFSEAYAAGGWTRISLTALMSSAYASMYGGPETALATPMRRTIAECLIEAGYWTCGLTANPVCGYLGGLHRGFGEFQDCRKKPELPAGAPEHWDQNWRYFMENKIPPRRTQHFIDASDLSDRALRWLARRDTREPYFLWLHYFDPHWPCQMARQPATAEELSDAWNDMHLFRTQVVPSRGTFDPGSAARSRWIQRYRDCLQSTDTHIGRLIDGLRERDDWSDTIVAVTGDHGEEFFEHGTWHHSWNQLHREGIQVPLIVRVPGIEPRVAPVPVSHIDLGPTLLDYAGITPPGCMAGISLRGFMEGAAEADRTLMAEMMGHYGSNNYRLAIWDKGWKYIYDMEHPHDSQLFHLASDPGERCNVRDRFPAVFRLFEQRRLAHITKGLIRLMPRQRSGVDPSGQQVDGQTLFDPFAGPDGIVLRQQLEQLGYM